MRSATIGSAINGERRRLRFLGHIMIQKNLNENKNQSTNPTKLNTHNFFEHLPGKKIYRWGWRWKKKEKRREREKQHKNQSNTCTKDIYIKKLQSHANVRWEHFGVKNGHVREFFFLHSW